MIKKIISKGKSILFIVLFLSSTIAYPMIQNTQCDNDCFDLAFSAGSGAAERGDTEAAFQYFEIYYISCSATC